MERTKIERSKNGRNARSRGVAMLMVMVAVGIVMTMALTFVAVNSTGNAIASSSSRQAHARHIAETGLMLAIREISGNPDWRTDYSEGQWVYGHAYGGGSFDIFGEDGEDEDGDRQIDAFEGDGNIADDPTDPLTITAVGAYGGAKYTVQVTLRPADPEITRNISLGTFEVESNAVVDSFESSVGAYGGANVGSRAVIGTNSTAADMIKLTGSGTINGDAYVGPGGDVNTVINIGGSATLTGSKKVLAIEVDIPDMTAPTDMGASVGDVSYSSGTTVINSDLHCDKFEITSGAVVQISGNVRILAQDTFEVNGAGSRLEILAGSELALYAKKQVLTEDDAEVNVNSADPMKFKIYYLSTDHIHFLDDSHVYATIIGKTALLHLKGRAHFYGVFAGAEVGLLDDSQMHHDLDASIPWADTTVLDTGIAVTDTFEIKDTAVVDSFDSNLGPYGGANVGTDASVSTNKTDSDKLKVKGTSVLNGDAWVGEAGDPVDVIQLDGGATISGDQAALPNPVPFAGYSEPSILPEAGDLVLSSGTTTVSGDLNVDKLT
ncbi:MAG: hypothetical protein OER86_12050, partial [Phycisphaerae bacterium]|nr:hypothetical protein [Phycisphaerae bacterium]